MGDKDKLFRVVWRNNPPELPLRKEADLLTLVTFTGGRHPYVTEEKARAYCIAWNDFRNKSAVRWGRYYDYMPELLADMWEKKQKEEKEVRR